MGGGREGKRNKERKTHTSRYKEIELKDEEAYVGQIMTGAGKNKQLPDQMASKYEICSTFIYYS